MDEVQTGKMGTGYRLLVVIKFLLPLATWWPTLYILLLLGAISEYLSYAVLFLVWPLSILIYLLSLRRKHVQSKSRLITFFLTSQSLLIVSLSWGYGLFLLRHGEGFVAYLISVFDTPTELVFHVGALILSGSLGVSLNLLWDYLKKRRGASSN